MDTTQSLPKPYYDRDGITIYHGDCRDILPLLDPGSVDLVLTDPPYGAKQSDQRRERRAAHDPGRDSGLPMIHGDDEPFDPSPVLAFRRLVLFGANHYADKLPPMQSWLVWDKRNDATPDDNADAELIWTNVPGVIRIYRQCWRGFARAGSESGKKHLHPTQKPIAIMEWLLDRYSKPGDLVLDPYMGSGPIAAACLRMGRRYIGAELDRAYVDVAVSRLSQAVLPGLEVA